MDEIPYLIAKPNRAPLTTEQLLDTFSMNMNDDKGSTWNCGSKLEFKNGSLTDWIGFEPDKNIKTVTVYINTKEFGFQSAEIPINYKKDQNE